MAEISKKRALATKRVRGTLSNVKNLEQWRNSDKYTHSTARQIHLYSICGDFLKTLNSVQSCLDYLEIKGSASHVIETCDKRRVFKNRFIFSWVFLGETVDVNNYGIDNMFYKPVLKLCPLTKSVLGRYDKVSDAAKHNNTTIQNISDAVISKGRCLGFYWIGESELKDISSIKFTKPSRPIFGINAKEDKIEYFSAKEAEIKLGLSKGSICNSIKYGYKCKGYVWNYKDINKQTQP